MKADLADLKDRVVHTLTESALGEKLALVDLEEGRDFDGGEFLRVIFRLPPVDDLSDQQLLDFARSVEDAVAAVDDRFASVRFADAA